MGRVEEFRKTKQIMPSPIARHNNETLSDDIDVLSGCGEKKIYPGSSNSKT